jgi:hypothetical protein
MENRAAVFTSKPQAVEVYQAGGWWPGELLGWRHAADGSCQVWVRVVLGGAEETAWTDLETLRLPERHLAMAPEPASAARAEREQSVARHPSSRREHRADAVATTTTATTTMTMVRDLSVVSDATAAPSGGRRRAPDVPVSTGGRRRAPEEPAVASSGGRRRAPETSPEMVAVSVPGGRRRAPDDVVVPSGGRRRAPEDSTSTVASPAALLGRHGVPAPAAASADPGRHRTADTGLFAAISDETSTISETRRPAAPAAAARGRALPSTLPAKPGGAGGSSAGSWTAPSGLESDLLTRPMRLSDHVPHARRPRVDGARRGV